MVDKEAVLERLRGIIDPDFNRNIVDLGFIRDLKITDKGDVSFEICLTTPACPVKQFFESEAIKRVRTLEGVRDVKVTLTAQKRTGESKRPKDSGLRQVGAVFAVSSCKGGVGKSTVSAAMALELANRGYRVGLLDADVYGPSVPTLFDLHEVPLRFDDQKQIVPYDYQSLKVMSFGFIIGESPAVMRGPMVSNYMQQLLHGVAWGSLDYLIVDMPPGTGDVQLTITQSIRLQGAIIVTTPHALSLADVGKGILMFEKVQVPVLGVIENMAFFRCDGCGKEHPLFGEESSMKLRERFGITLIGRLPLNVLFGRTLRSQDEKRFGEVMDTAIRQLGKTALKQDDLPHIHYDNQGITLRWKTGKTLSHGNKFLRYYCMSAKNVDEHTGGRMVKWTDIANDIEAKNVDSLGNYAITVLWNDGHRSILSYEYLETLTHKKGQAEPG